MILDVGCGAGEFEEGGKRRGDINIDVRKPKNKPHNFILCDGQRLPFQSDTFSKALMIDVIEHLEKPVEALKELKRVVMPKGKIILGTPNALFFPKVIRTWIKGGYLPHKDHIITFGIPELQNILKRTGFKSFKIEVRTYCTDKNNFGFKILSPFLRSELKGRQLVAIINN